MINENKVISLIESNDALTAIIKVYAYKLDEFYPIESTQIFFNSIALLQTLAMQESTYGTNNVPRYEPAYGPGGTYFKAVHVNNLYEKYGKDAACSWSSFQIMFVTAFELGYRGSPKDLSDDTIAIEWVIKYIKKRILKFIPATVQQIFDAYNSGSFKDRYIPVDYIKSCNFYYEIISEYNSNKETEKVIKASPEQLTFVPITDLELTMFIKEIQYLKDRLNQLEINLLKKKG